MPELPEVETSVQAIQEFTNQNLESIQIYNQFRWKNMAAFKKLHGLKVSKSTGEQNIFSSTSSNLKYLFI